MVRKGKTAMMAGALGALALFVAPAIAASASKMISKRAQSAGLRTGIGSFTPAAADPRMAAAYARTGITSASFRFTPATPQSNRPVTVAVRARINRPALASASQDATASPGIGIAPVAYNLGASVGWKHFALSGDVARIDTAGLPGGRESAKVGVSYNAKKWATRVQVGADRPAGTAPRTINGSESYSVDLGGSYSLSRNLDVTAGVRYKAERDRLQPLPDNRRDSQAVYVGTAFRF